MHYAEVAVNSPGTRSTYTYGVPQQLPISVGQAVWVPFGAKTLQGIVVGLSAEPAVSETREIADVIDREPLLTPGQIDLARWISDTYIAPFFDAIALMLPPGFGRSSIAHFEVVDPSADSGTLSPEQKRVLSILGGKQKTTVRDVERALGKHRARLLTTQLMERGLITRSWELEETKVRPKTVRHVELVASRDQLQTAIARTGRGNAHKQAQVLEFLVSQPHAVSTSQITRSVNCSASTIAALERQGLIAIKKVRVRRDPLSHISIPQSSAPELTRSQQDAWEDIRDGWDAGSASVFLLFGVTGSGKTEIYLRALAHAVAVGKRGICLVPEIALTRQTVERFASRFPGRVAVLHSGLSLGERLDEWQWIRNGNCDVVVGPRSALFAPLPRIGLIIVDEEHEWTYKQEDSSPRYHARDVALQLARHSGAAVILGSATPDIASFRRAKAGDYRLVELRERITAHGLLPLPKVTVVDSREELKAGNTGLFSRALSAAMTETLAQEEQAILFLNRRGTATFIRCRSCGFAFRCPRCSVALTYHSVERTLTCHRCSYSIPVPEHCPQCLKRRLSFLGIGTQRVEEEVKGLFPQARVLRWDRDATAGKHAHDELLRSFLAHEADVLIGTQMIAKGLDLPQVTLAGVINADMGLNLPDFRSAERTFQLLCQVAGRAGRGRKVGKVFIQTYSPDNYAVQAAARHDYVSFYQREIEYRRRHDYPPFTSLVRLVYSHRNEEKCQREAERVAQLVLDRATTGEAPGPGLIGPAPAFAARMRGSYRWQLLVRGHDATEIVSKMQLPRGWIVDVDPVSTA